MYTIFDAKHNRYVMYDEKTMEFFVLGENAIYNGSKPTKFRTDDKHSAVEVWKCFGGAYGDFEIMEDK